jgi:hypothetical protein
MRSRKKRRKKKIFRIKRAVYHSPRHKEYRVRSRGEKAVEDWFHKNKVQHIYEPKSKCWGGYIPDWLTASGHIVEFFGYNSNDYRKRTRAKIDYYINTLQCKFIALYPEDLDDLDKKLKDVL